MAEFEGQQPQPVEPHTRAEAVGKEQVGDERLNPATGLTNSEMLAKVYERLFTPSREDKIRGLVGNLTREATSSDPLGELMKEAGAHTDNLGIVTGGEGTRYFLGETITVDAGTLDSSFSIDDPEGRFPDVVPVVFGVDYRGESVVRKGDKVGVYRHDSQTGVTRQAERAAVLDAFYAKQGYRRAETYSVVEVPDGTTVYVAKEKNVFELEGRQININLTTRYRGDHGVTFSGTQHYTAEVVIVNPDGTVSKRTIDHSGPTEGEYQATEYDFMRVAESKAPYALPSLPLPRLDQPPDATRIRGEEIIEALRADAGIVQEVAAKLKPSVEEEDVLNGLRVDASSLSPSTTGDEAIRFLGEKALEKNGSGGKDTQGSINTSKIITQEKGNLGLLKK